jgi:predicted dehydrogenase
MKNTILFLSLTFFCFEMKAQKDTSVKQPLKVAVIGLVHNHVHGILGRENRGDIEIVAIVEPDKAIAEKYSKQYGFDMGIVHCSMNAMLKKVKPQAVCAFNSTYDHLKVVETFAPLGIHVMVEKPLAVNVAHATKMLTLAKKHNIHLLTNYETTWYGSNEKAYELIKKEQVAGDIRKIVFHTGHKGPKEIGCSKEFLDWLTDPVLNGAGALMDFGCYGANLSTWLMNGEHPETISCFTQQIKPKVYPKVDDEATILLTYKKAQVIVQASWNWPFSVKDMEVYGATGFVFCKDGTNMLVRKDEKEKPVSIAAPALPVNRNDPFTYFANVINGDIKMQPYDLSSEKNNEMVVKILAAAKAAAKTGKTIVWNELYKTK